MKISGIVCEYNPFHNGHLYHIEKTRKNGATHIIAVMSGNFVQRGDAAILDKFTRAELAVKSGADLVIELPTAYCLSSAEKFAWGAVYLLHSLGVTDELSFGSECGSVEKLFNAMAKADGLVNSDEVRVLMKKGYSYPRALCESLKNADEEASEIISEPNNLLGVEYIRALKSLNSDILPFTVKRSGASHDSMENAGGYVSASYIRSRILSSESAEGTMPEIWENAITDGCTASLKNLERVMLYRVRTASIEEISKISDSNGLAERIYRNGAASLEELLDSVKSKRYTMARIKRVILSLMIGITKIDTETPPPYARVLAFNERGREILAAAKNKKKIPLGTSLAKLGRLSCSAQRFAELEARATDIYGIAAEKMFPAGSDYRVKTEISKE